MSKLSKLIKATSLLLRKPYLINKIIDDNEVWMKEVEQAYGINGFQEIKLKDLNPKGEMQVKPFAFLEGGSLPTDLALLRILALRYEKCKYFEIGTWRGESVANVAEVAEECTSMNLSEEEMTEIGLDPLYIDQHAMFSEELNNVTHLKENSLDFDFNSMNRRFDLIFIDGDHHFDSICKDSSNIFKHLVHENSIVVWHDYAWQPGHIRYETMAAILKGVPEEFHKNLYAVRNTLCAIYFPGAVKSYMPSPVAIREEAFEINLNTIRDNE